MHNATKVGMLCAVGRPSCRSSSLGDPGAKFLVETGHRNRTMKNSLNYVSTCLKIVDTRRNSRGLLHRVFACKRHQMWHLCDIARLLAKQAIRLESPDRLFIN